VIMGIQSPHRSLSDRRYKPASFPVRIVDHPWLIARAERDDARPNPLTKAIGMNRPRSSRLA
jgi:hypothetical protein